MFKVLSILPETTTFLVENTSEAVSLIEIFKPNRADLFLIGNVVQLYMAAEKTIQIIAEDTDKYKWTRRETNDR